MTVHQPMSSLLYLVRHGQTEWNTAARFQGQTDSPLTELGRSQARANGRALARHLENRGSGRPPMRAYVSPLGRARATAELIAGELPLDLTIEPRLMEVDFGDWEGLTRDEVFATFGTPAALPTDWQFRAPGGETLETVRARVAAVLAEIQAPCLIVTHGVISRIVRGVYAGLDDATMLKLAVPQDGYFQLHAGSIDFVPAAP